MTPRAKRLASVEALKSASPIAPLARVARIIADKPKLKPIAMGLIRAAGQLGAEEAAREIEWLAAQVHDGRELATFGANGKAPFARSAPAGSAT